MCRATCEYVAEKNNPNTWHGDGTYQWRLDQSTEDGGLEITEWRCPHPSLEERDRCVFHTDPEELPDGVNESKQLLRALNEAGESPFDDGPEHRGQFVGATFGNLNLTDEDIVATDEYDVRFDYAVFRGIDEDLNFRNTRFVTLGQRRLSFYRATFKTTSDSDTDFSQATFKTAGTGDLVFKRAKFKTVDEGNVTFERATFETAAAGNVDFERARFNTADTGDVDFSDTTFRTAGTGNMLFIDATFETAGNGYLLFPDVTFRTDGDGYIFFSEATFETTGKGNLFFSDATFETAGNGHIDYSQATFKTSAGYVSFTQTTFKTGGKGNLFFSDTMFKTATNRPVDFSLATFKTEGDGDVAFEGATFKTEGDVAFENATFKTSGDGDVVFKGGMFETTGDGYVGFYNATFETSGDSNVDFGGATFETAGDGIVAFEGAKFGTDGNGTVLFREADFIARTEFSDLDISGTATLSFMRAEFHDKIILGTTKGVSQLRGQFNFSRVSFFEPPNFLGGRQSIDHQADESTGEAAFDAVFVDSVDFTGVQFPDGFDFSNFRFSAESSFEDANLSGVNFSGSDLSGVSFERAQLNRAELLGANLQGAHLYGALLGDTRINRNTQFWPEAEMRLHDVWDVGDTRVGGGSWRQLKTVIRRNRVPYCVEDPRYAELEIEGLPPQREADLEKAAEVYTTIEQIARANSLPRLASEAFLGRKDVQYREYCQEGRLTMRMRSFVPNLVSRYGESPWRVLSAGAFIIGAWGGIYWIFNLIEPITDASDPSLWDSMYFSALTFTTLGYGDFRPVNGLGQFLAVSETALGVILLAILVFVFGRRATR